MFIFHLISYSNITAKVINKALILLNVNQLMSKFSLFDGNIRNC